MTPTGIHPPTTSTSAMTPTEIVAAFNAAFDRHDVDGVMALMTPDCVFDDTTPPDGRRHDGADAVRAAWESFFSASPTARFTTEEVIAAGDRVVVRWRYDWADQETPGHVRGVDLFHVVNGLIAEKSAYVKG